MLNISDEPIDSWLQALKPYQRHTLAVFLEELSPEGAAERWLTTIGSHNIASFGGSAANDPKPFWDKFKAECHKFICDDESYAQEKTELLNEVPISKPLLISVMSSAIGAYMGTAGTLIAPAVTLILFTVGKLGRNAYCAK